MVDLMETTREPHTKLVYTRTEDDRWFWPATEEWITRTVESLEVMRGERAGALWPLGWSRNDPAQRWFLNKKAEALLTG